MDWEKEMMRNEVTGLGHNIFCECKKCNPKHKGYREKIESHPENCGPFCYLLQGEHEEKDILCICEK